VIEHLLNPLLFFNKLSKATTADAQVVLSFPGRPKWFWNNREHFHEYDKLRFKLLLDKSGWVVLKKKNIYVRRWPLGIRPLLRNFIPQTTIYWIVKKDAAMSYYLYHEDL
jgi:hypothetical protein